MCGGGGGSRTRVPFYVRDHLHRPRPGGSERCCGKSLDREEARFEVVFQKNSCKSFTAMGAAADTDPAH
jgi:hypothetical protein